MEVQGTGHTGRTNSNHRGRRSQNPLSSASRSRICRCRQSRVRQDRLQRGRRSANADATARCEGTSARGQDWNPATGVVAEVHQRVLPLVAGEELRFAAVGLQYGEYRRGEREIAVDRGEAGHQVRARGRAGRCGTRHRRFPAHDDRDRGRRRAARTGRRRAGTVGVPATRWRSRAGPLAGLGSLARRAARWIARRPVGSWPSVRTFQEPAVPAMMIMAMIISGDKGLRTSSRVAKTQRHERANLTRGRMVVAVPLSAGVSVTHRGVPATWKLRQRAGRPAVGRGVAGSETGHNASGDRPQWGRRPARDQKAERQSSHCGGLRRRSRGHRGSAADGLFDGCRPDWSRRNGL